MELRTPYNYDVKEAGQRTAIDASKGDRTHQEFKDECDINTIIERFGIGTIETKAQLPMYGDFTSVTDYHTAMTAVREAAEQFMLLPADVRRNFGNDPQALVEFTGDPSKTRDDYEAFGLVEKRVSNSTPIPEPEVAPEPAPGPRCHPVGVTRGD